MAFRDFSILITHTYSKLYPAFLTAASSSLVFIIPAAVVLHQTDGAGESFIPMVLLFLVVGGGFFFPLLKLMFMFGNLNQISIGTERIGRILDTGEIPESAGDANPADTSIEFDHVSFAYEETTVLDDVSFRAELGTITALVGPSGAGKTTMGLLAAAKAAQCHEFIEELPRGYATLVGEGGTYLSGGEQRVGIARAILKNAPIVVFDEATAYADPENEGKILSALSHLIQEKTVIVIAHRLSTITSADQIIVVNEGRIEERGTHDALVAAGGLYGSMWDTYSRAREWKIEQ
ncbi:ABC transporter ATP-binding protein [Salinispira pacifica]|uniref:ABC transporter ATP-binding protein n=2 Tax=Salinispira pacifica TaxID=1307761 RepID=V5WDC8_9SPIO|nr:ABC transporter ATP-binding protein [Salinispira pacifica]